MNGKLQKAALALFLCLIPAVALAQQLPEVTSPFGWRSDPLTGAQRFHAGVDFALPMDTPVAALYDGRVVEAEWQEGYGNEVLLYHRDSDTYTRYAHCNALAAQKGQFVQSGGVIAYVGSTGRATGPHLHLEYIFKRDGVYQYADPLTLWER